MAVDVVANAKADYNTSVANKAAATIIVYRHHTHNDQNFNLLGAAKIAVYSLIMSLRTIRL